MSKKIFKIVLMGDQFVGKTSIRRRFMGENFDKEYLVTLGADFAVKNYVIGDTTLVMQIWDLAGQEKFAPIRDRYYKNTHGILLVFDRTKNQSFINVNKWIDEYMQNTNNQMVPITLLGNKSDIIETAEEVVADSDVIKYLETLEEWGKTTFSDFKVKYFETSAVTGQNINEAFEYLGNVFLEI